jgi:hypothetical protein
MEAQLGLLDVGITPRARNVYAPSRMRRDIVGAFVPVNATEPKPSQPITITCSTPAIAGLAMAPVKVSKTTPKTASVRFILLNGLQTSCLQKKNIPV